MQKYIVEVSDNQTEWRDFDSGKRHRIDGPAREFVNGSKSWWVDGNRHRVDGPAVECADGSKSWYQNGKLHRVDGPACEWANGSKDYWIDGKKHRLDGPAYETPNGYKEWWIDGKEYTEQEFNEYSNPVKELSVAELEKLLGYKIKVVK